MKESQVPQERVCTYIGSGRNSHVHAEDQQNRKDTKENQHEIQKGTQAKKAAILEKESKTEHKVNSFK